MQEAIEIKCPYSGKVLGEYPAQYRQDNSQGADAKEQAVLNEWFDFVQDFYGQKVFDLLTAGGVNAQLALIIISQ